MGDGFLGISEASPDSIRRAHTTAPLSAVQTEWSLFTRDVEDDGVLATVRELGIGFVPYSPLGRGFLSGKIRSFEDLEPDDFRRSSPRFQGKNFAKNLELLDRVVQLAHAGLLPRPAPPAQCPTGPDAQRRLNVSRSPAADSCGAGPAAPRRWLSIC